MTDCCKTFTITSDCYTITIGMPIWGGEANQITKQHAKFQFWSDNYAVNDVGIEGQPLILSGIEVLCGYTNSVYYGALCFPLCFPLCFTAIGAPPIPLTTDLMHAKFIHLHEIMDNHEEVTISGLGDCMDAVYIIKDLKVDTISKYGINALSWSLTLEKVRD